MLTNPHTWERAVRWILILGVIRVVTVMWATASTVGRLVAWMSRDTTHSDPLDHWYQMFHITVWNVGVIAESVVLTFIGMAICLAVARYLRHTDMAPGRERTSRAGEGESEGC